MLHCAQRRAVAIERRGDKLVDQLVDADVVHTPADLYRLGIGALANLERMAEKSANNLLASIEKSKRTKLPKFLFGLGSRHGGENTGKDSDKYVGT